MCTNLVINYPGTTTPDPATPALVLGARSLEFTGQLPTSLFWVPSGQVYPQIKVAPVNNPQGDLQLGWTSQYAFVGIAYPNPSGEGYCFMDGLNSQGLSVGGLWLPGTNYPQTATGPYLWFSDLGAWLLGNFATAAHAYEALQTTCVVGPASPTQQQKSPGFAPLHFIVTDPGGNSLVVEFVNGVSATLYPPGQNTSNGVLTNAPPYDWQCQNLANYANLSAIGGQTSTGPVVGAPVGAGLTGMPGDPMSQSRFVRAATFVKAVEQLAPDGTGWLPAPNGTANGGTVQTVQTLVNVTMQIVQMAMQTPYGTMLAPAATTGGYPTVADWTMWSVVRDHTNLVYYYTTAFNGILRSVSLGALAGQRKITSITLLPDVFQSDWSLDVSTALAGS